MESKAFFLRCIDQMRLLDEDQRPIWGSMSPQHMVEHIVGSWRISNGRARVGLLIKGDELIKRRDFLFSDTPYERNIPNPTFAKGAPPLRKPSLASAIDQLEDEMMAFFAYHETHPGAIEMHPVFGELDYQGWLIFQGKHMKHHMMQFGLL